MHFRQPARRYGRAQAEDEFRITGGLGAQAQFLQSLIKDRSLPVNVDQVLTVEAVSDLASTAGKAAQGYGQRTQALWLSILLPLHILDVISDELAARKPASIGRLRAGRLETRVNSGLAGSPFGEARFTRGSGQVFRRMLWRGYDRSVTELRFVATL